MTLKNENILEVERRSTRSLSVENSLWKQLCTLRKIDYVVVMMMMMLIKIFTLPYRLHRCNSVKVCLGKNNCKKDSNKTHIVGPTDAFRIR